MDKSTQTYIAIVVVLIIVLIAGYYWYTHYYHATCTKDADCATTETCVSGKCQKKPTYY